MQIGFVGLLTLLFAAAKLFGYTAWSWWLVFSPVLISLGIVAVLFVIALVLAVAAS